MGDDPMMSGFEDGAAEGEWIARWSLISHVADAFGAPERATSRAFGVCRDIFTALCFMAFWGSSSACILLGAWDGLRLAGRICLLFFECWVRYTKGTKTGDG